MGTVVVITIVVVVVLATVGVGVCPAVVATAVGSVSAAVVVAACVVVVAAVPLVPPLSSPPSAFTVAKPPIPSRRIAPTAIPTVRGATLRPSSGFPSGSGGGGGARGSAGGVDEGGGAGAGSLGGGCTAGGADLSSGTTTGGSGGLGGKTAPATGVSTAGTVGATGGGSAVGGLPTPSTSPQVSTAHRDASLARPRFVSNRSVSWATRLACMPCDDSSNAAPTPSEAATVKTDTSALCSPTMSRSSAPTRRGSSAKAGPNLATASWSALRASCLEELASSSTRCSPTVSASC